MSKLYGLAVRGLFVVQNVKNAIFGCSQFQKLIFWLFTPYALDLFTKNWNHIQILFLGLKYIPPSFWPWLTNHDMKSKNFKKWFLRSLLFYTIFSWCRKIEEKTKNICEGYTKIWVCTTYRVNIWKISPEAAKVSTLVKFFNVEKIPHTGDKASLDRCG